MPKSAHALPTPTGAPGGPTENPALTALRDSYAQVARDLIRPLVELFAIARSVCGGDGECSEILLLIALRTVEHPAFGKLTYEEIVSGRADAYQSLITNMRSISDSTGIARETVRRKVRRLVALGWVGREDNGVFLNPAASPALTPLREALLRLAAQNHDLVRSLLDRRA
jgi:hypothetical protein